MSGKSICECIKLISAAAGAALSYFLGGLDGLLLALVIMVTLDYITGVMSAVIHRRLSSATGFKGIFHKVLIFILVGVGHTLDYYVLKHGDILRSAVIFYYIANEGISIVENAAEIGVPIPEKLRNALIQIKKESEDNGNTDESRADE